MGNQCNELMASAVHLFILVLDPSLTHSPLAGCGLHVTLLGVVWRGAVVEKTSKG